MKTKKGIDTTKLEAATVYLNRIKLDQFKEFGYINQVVPMIIEMLQQGEADSKELKITKKELKKVWQMWKEVKKKYGDYFSVFGIKKVLFSEHMKKIKQKYFPKDVIT